MKDYTVSENQVVNFFSSGLENALRQLECSETYSVPRICDSFQMQVEAIIRSKDPVRTWSSGEIEAEVKKYSQGKSLTEIGVWVYYPWNGNLVHVLREADFITMRTDRNRNKITEAEQQTLSTKRVGVVGLSVGQSVSLTLAMERSFGELRIADFDILEISNLNRIRAGLHNLGLSKTVVTSREIAEIDPYLQVSTFDDGVSEDNIDRFIMGNGKLDVIIDECDSLDVKVLIRQKAKEYGIPVLMDTSDRGMLDVERFDLEPDRRIFHGLIAHLPTVRLAGLTNQEKIPYISALIGGEEMSPRLRESLGQVGKSLSTWPQLASAVTAGGAHTAAVCRKILLGQSHKSGRYYMDPETLVP